MVLLKLRSSWKESTSDTDEELLSLVPHVLVIVAQERQNGVRKSSKEGSIGKDVFFLLLVVELSDDLLVELGQVLSQELQSLLLVGLFLTVMDCGPDSVEEGLVPLDVAGSEPDGAAREQLLVHRLDRLIMLNLYRRVVFQVAFDVLSVDE